jgi:hypothetical protein
VAQELLGGLAGLAPDVPLPRLLGEVAALRAPALGGLDLVASALLWTLVVLLLVAAPLPARLRAGVDG